MITVGSPFGGDLKSNVVWPMYESITGTRIKSIPKEMLDRMNDPLPVPSTAIYSRTDGVVAWHSCIDEEAPEAENVHVPGSHIGLLHNPAALYVIADRLAQPPGTHEPFRAPALAAGVRRPGAVAPDPIGARVMTRMRAMDAAFLAMERPAEPRHLGRVSIIGPGRRGPLTYDVVRAALEERLDLITSARRVVVPTPLGHRSAVVGAGRRVRPRVPPPPRRRRCPGAARRRWPSSWPTSTPCRSTARARCGSCG